MANVKTTEDRVVDELVAIKRLLVFAIMRTGVSQKQIGDALGISQSSVSRMLPDSPGKSATTKAKAA